ncbi:hypothetical protein [Yersinia mollaretii]|uniref:Baseplate assembly protein n=1 Tax=Yersinia mollaretii TaxID=33060 RepID=A0AA36LK00_YERMO|nr:hypothetical protein [Yersinia mollaretii]MDA5526862.1 hypothetical protein [Yersinia mollaretii]MDA5534374.1 hypothetical protein [Yersinia mollaretii]MDR7872257.1 hypothetical protein [Yersinia mollaretii]WQC73225.1 hypothetical protein U1Z61_12140 [Yersinia mollaretii]CNE62317.1 baseplate assembly protein [Yersinia mollaretii]
MTNAEIYRLIMNLIRFGIVEQVNLALDPPKARMRCGERELSPMPKPALQLYVHYSAISR